MTTTPHGYNLKQLIISLLGFSQLTDDMEFHGGEHPAITYRFTTDKAHVFMHRVRKLDSMLQSALESSVALDKRTATLINHVHTTDYHDLGKATIGLHATPVIDLSARTPISTVYSVTVVVRPTKAWLPLFDLMQRGFISQRLGQLRLNVQWSTLLRELNADEFTCHGYLITLNDENHNLIFTRKA